MFKIIERSLLIYLSLKIKTREKKILKNCGKSLNCIITKNFSAGNFIQTNIPRKFFISTCFSSNTSWLRITWYACNFTFSRPIWQHPCRQGNSNCVARSLWWIPANPHIASNIQKFETSHVSLRLCLTSKYSGPLHSFTKKRNVGKAGGKERQRNFYRR